MNFLTRHRITTTSYFSHVKQMLSGKGKDEVSLPLMSLDIREALQTYRATHSNHPIPLKLWLTKYPLRLGEPHCQPTPPSRNTQVGLDFDHQPPNEPLKRAEPECFGIW